ncbi:MAG: DUF2256 domain-containing protein [Corynebacteriales bacterium]|uniref:DUF2256 domain-containing protein n=1 Tax=Williamsia herbipolensis TaxID=1603258 RepID=A0AAU4JZD7_9NOCA|nr:DUF2256 domain-containing protein [Williamsia herbipolensis]MCX6468333.1 DUF2256 domain-containing protein [Mycobacteriales bacterium]
MGRQRGDSADWRESKACEVCGRPFDNRKRWAARGQWDDVRYCSAKCRAQARRERRAPHPT